MRRLASAVAAGLAFAACGGGKAAKPSPATTSAAAAAYVDIGVPECDGYAREYLACLDRVPEGSRAMMRQSFEQTREHWSLVAEKPERRASLAAACAQQEQASRAAMSRYDCDF
jgi:hypothetical protein